MMIGLREEDIFLIFFFCFYTIFAKGFQNTKVLQIFQDKSILVTGGTGSFGQKFIQRIFNEYKNIKKLLVFSRDEFKQFQLKQMFPQNYFPQLDFILGDVRDLESLENAFQNIDIVIHAAALKQVNTSEKYPLEFIKTNILGAENVIKAAKKQKVKKVIAISSDKAVMPVSLYGATKLCADKLFLAENNSNTTFAVVRYGNVLGARASVIPLFLEQKKNNKALTITNLEMTRFLMPAGSEVELVLEAIRLGKGREIFVAKCPSVILKDLAEAICKECPKEIIGLRAGEKLHEEMICEADAPFTFENDKYFLTLPHLDLKDEKTIQDILEYYQVKKVPENFTYHSKKNQLLSVEFLKEIIQKID